VIGTYETSGSMIAVSAGGQTETDSYCVQGDTLSIFGTAATAMTTAPGSLAQATLTRL